MIKLNEIKRAVVLKIKSGFPELKVFTEDISQVKTVDTTDKVFPLFHVQLSPMSSSLCSGSDSKNKAVLIDITYMEESVSDNADMYDVLDELETVLGACLQVSDRVFTIEVLNKLIADDIAHLTFTLEYRDELPADREVFDKYKDIKISI